MPDHDSKIMSSDFKEYDFYTTSADMFTPAEDLVLQSGPVWHGTALGWNKSIDKFITKLPIISDRFCGVQYVDANTDTSVLAYTAYLPTSGQDEAFLQILTQLKFDIEKNNTKNSVIIVGTDSNCSMKSTRRRLEAMKKFLKFSHSKQS